MKSVFTVLFLVISIDAKAASLETLWAAQVQTTIQPIEVDGKLIFGDQFNAASVCTSLGYARLVSFESKPCELYEQIATFSPNYGAVLPLGETKKCGSTVSSGVAKLVSVTCAR